MDKQLLLELRLYIETNKTDGIVIRESDMTFDYMMPMKSSIGTYKEHVDEALSQEEVPKDNAFLEQFRKKSAARTGDGDYEEVSFSGSLVSEEDELEDYIKKVKSKETFSTKILQYIDKLKLSDAKIYKRAGIDRRHFSKIRCDKYYQPKKATAIALCMALQLTIDETIDLLGMAGYSLSSSDTGDLVIKFCIERGIYDLIEVNEALDYFGQKLLGVL